MSVRAAGSHSCCCLPKSMSCLHTCCFHDRLDKEKRCAKRKQPSSPEMTSAPVKCALGISYRFLLFFASAVFHGFLLTRPFLSFIPCPPK